MVRRKRACGLVKKGKVVGNPCGAVFWTTELPVGWSCDVTISMTDSGIDASVRRKKKSYG